MVGNFESQTKSIIDKKLKIVKYIVVVKGRLSTFPSRPVNSYTNGKINIIRTKQKISILRKI